MAKKFENTRSEIHALVVDIEKMTKNEAEYISDEYVRSIVKAENIIREALNIEKDAIVKVTEIVQLSEKAKEYNINKMVHDGFIIEDEARPIEDDELCVPVIQYFYSANVFAEDEELIPYANSFMCDSLNKFTKGNAREYIEMRYSEIYNHKIVAVTNIKREEVTKYVIAAKVDFAEYEVK